MLFCQSCLLCVRVCKINTIFGKTNIFCPLFSLFPLSCADSVGLTVAKPKPVVGRSIGVLRALKFKENHSTIFLFLCVWNNILSVCRIFCRFILCFVQKVWCFLLIFCIFAVLIERNALSLQRLHRLFADIVRLKSHNGCSIFYNKNKDYTSRLTKLF